MIDVTPPNIPSQTIENFLPLPIVNKILEFYDNATQIVNKFENTTDCRIVEVGCSPKNKEITKIKYVTRKDYKALSFSKQHKIIKKIKKQKLFDWSHDIKDILEENFEANNLSAEVKNINIHNLHQSFEIHCDGRDLDQKLDKRPKSFPEYDMTQYSMPAHDYAHQGLITLRNDADDNGTIIFDQWFPISTYLEQHKNPELTKENIRFFKGEPLERFGEKIRNYTNQPMPESDYQQIMDIVKNETLFTREQAHGLTLDKILKFGKPGTLNVWADKKYHMTIPKTKTEWSKNRILLQYESVFTK